MVFPSESVRAIIEKLKGMVEVDQAMRNRGIDNPSEWGESVDHQNTESLKAIIEEIAWPSISKVGYEASSHAWLLAQHADHDPAFQKKCLSLMKEEPINEVPKNHIAFLEDRIAVGDGRPQIYGTQFYTNENGQLEPQAIFDLENVDDRRKEMWLEPLSKYKEQMETAYDRKSA